MAEPAQDRIHIRKSEFIGVIEPIDAMAAVKARIGKMRAEHPNARHVAWAARVGNRVRMDDDGEPSGTAGRPILNVLEHQGIDQVLLMVVRYFGGIKLGAGGLTRAYGQAASLVVQQASFIPYVARLTVEIETGFAHESTVRRIAEQHGGVLGAAEYGSQWSVILELPESEWLACRQELVDGCQGRIEICVRQR